MFSSKYDSDIGNIINSIIIATLVSSVNNIILTQISGFMHFLFEHIKNFISHLARFFNVNKGEVVLYGLKIVSSEETNIYFPISCKAVLYKMKTKNINFNSITENTETCADYDNYNFQKFNFFVNDNYNYFDIEPNLKIKFKTSSTSMNGKDFSSTHYKLSMIIFSKILSVQEILEKISEYIKEYIDVTEKYNYEGKIYCYETCVPHYTREGIENKKIIVKWNKNILKSSKTFSNIFFDDKEILLKKLNFFLNNEKWYVEKGIPYTLGFLFHGEPGCGKTSTIKALANFTKRHILQINLKNIKTCGEFANIFNNFYVDGNFIPTENRIIVLEDIDCMIDIIKKRNEINQVNQENQNNAENQENQNTENTENKDNKDNKDNVLFSMLLQNTKKEKPDYNDNLTLSCILNTIDGIVENHGRIMIITTNYIEKLDSALIRPGRMDMKINFAKCSAKTYKNIIEHFYGITLNTDLKIEEFKYSPAELLELCFRNHEDVKKLLEIL